MTDAYQPRLLIKAVRELTEAVRELTKTAHETQETCRQILDLLTRRAAQESSRTPEERDANPNASLAAREQERKP